MSFFTFWGRTVDGGPPGVALSPRCSSSPVGRASTRRNPSVEDLPSPAVGHPTFCQSVKVAIVGESSVGKSALAWRYCKGGFTSFGEPTVGASFLWRIAEIPMPTTSATANTANQGKKSSSKKEEEEQGSGRGPPPSHGITTQRIKFEIWDTAGQERYRCLVPVYYRGVTAALVVYDVTDHSSFECCTYWIQEIRRSMNRKTFFTILVGTKADRAEDRAVFAEEGAELAEREGISGFLETSAKDGINVEELFTTLGQLILEGLAAAGETLEGAGNSSTTNISPSMLTETGNHSNERRSSGYCC